MYANSLLNSVAGDFLSNLTLYISCTSFRTAKTASSYYRLERVCQCQKTCCRGFCSLYLVYISYTLFLPWFLFYALESQVFLVITITRNEKNQLLLGIRRATRPQTVMPSSVLSSDSMHIGLLAAAAHAASTNSCFTVFYNPRWQTILKVSSVMVNIVFSSVMLVLALLSYTGLVHLSLSYPFQNMLKLYFTHEYQLGCASGCSLRLKSQVSEGKLVLNFQWHISSIIG